MKIATSRVVQWKSWLEKKEKGKKTTVNKKKSKKNGKDDENNNDNIAEWQSESSYWMLSMK